MKSEEQILLSYMYEKGYMDEDMFDVQTMNKVRYSLEFSIHRFNLAFPKIVGAFKVFADKVAEIWTNVKESVQENFPIIKELSSIEPKLPQYKTFEPIDFSERPRIEHQVIDRKPKHITRKIIH